MQNAEHRTVIESSHPIETRGMVFGVRDAKGRAVGCRAKIALVVYVEAGPGACVWHEVAPGVWYEFEPSATRDGDAFGAWQRARRFRTRQACQDAVSSYIQRAQKRAQKRWG